MVFKMYFVWSVAVLFSFLALRFDIVIATTVKARCTDNMELFADGVSKGSHSDKNTVKTYTISDSTEVVAIKCVADASKSARGGVFASFKTEYDGDYQTDNTWRCSSAYTAGWNSKSFDDSIWSYAATSGTNAATANGLTKISGIDTSTNWIWTPSFSTATGDLTVYCRGYPKIPQTYDSYGRRFVIGFMENNKGNPRKDIKLLFTTLAPTDVTIHASTPRLSSSSSLNVDTTLTVKSGEVKTLILPRDLRHYDTEIKDYGLLVTASEAVKIIGLNQEMYSTDMCLFLPITSLGTATTATTYYTVMWDADSNSRVVMMAGYDSTVIKVKSPKVFQYKNANQNANSEISITLAKYQSVQLKASSGFTGTKITSNKPIVVFSGNKKARVDNGISGSSSDHLVEQLTPTRNWGQKFIITPMFYSSDGTKGRMGSNLEKYKYVAAESSTTITIKNYYTSGAAYGSPVIFTLNAGNYKDINHKRGTYAVVTSNKGIQVAQFATTMTRSSSSYGTSGNCMGDPWLQMIPPVQAFGRDYGLLTPTLVDSSTCPAQHFVTILVKDTEKSGITVKIGSTIKVPDWTKDGVKIATTDLVYITYNIPYHLTNGVRVQHTKTSVSFGVYFFGYGRMDSYATMGGSRMTPINEPCQKTTPTMGDGIDNDCDGKVDEDACSSNSLTKDCALPTPVNGGWSSWSKEGACGCYAGVTSPKQTYKRLCNNPMARYNGYPCDGSDTKYESCTCVKIDGGWSSWGAWGQCDKTCGTGSRSRLRSCNNPFPSTYPAGAACPGSRSGTGSCLVKQCPVNGGWSAWSKPTIKCTTGKAAGIKTFTRSCTNPAPAHGGNQCSGSTSKTETHSCAINGGWTSYGAWTSCTKTCGTGSKTRKRTCTNPTPAYAGANCAGSATETAACNTTPCPINGGWTAYGAWATCTKSCATGSKTRTRTCTKPAPQHGGKNCAGSTSETATCNTHNCPIDGKWTSWVKSQGCDCSALVGTGKQTYKRTCTNPAPQYNGKACSTSPLGATDVRDCTCHIDGLWGKWSAWASCTATCGKRTKTRTRQCNNPPKANNGKDCVGSNSDTVNCTWVYCPINGAWAAWTTDNFCKCPVKSGDGKMTHNRTCTNPKPQYNGLECPGIKTKQTDCKCVLDGIWASWGSWGTCSLTCGTGSWTRKRTCTDPAPLNGGKDCPDKPDEATSCLVVECPIHGGWSAWEDVSQDCINNQYDGTNNQIRYCNNPAPKYNGDTCVGSDTQVVSFDCIQDASASDKYQTSRNMTCAEEKKGKKKSLGDCMVDCLTDSTCYAVVYDQKAKKGCALMTDCTPTSSPSSSTSEEVLFLKKSLITTTPVFGEHNVDINGHGAQGGDANNADASAQGGDDASATMAPAIGGAVAGAAVLGATIFVVARKLKKKKKEEPKPQSKDADDMEIDDMEDEEMGGQDNEAPYVEW